MDLTVAKFETWWVKRGTCLFDEKRQGGGSMDWDVVVLKLTAEDGTEGVSCAMAARSGEVTEGYLKSVAPVVLGRSAHEREAIFHELWNIDRHEAFFPVFLPGPIDVALWDMAAKKAGLPLYRYLGAYRDSLPVYASSIFYDDPQVYVDEAIKYRELGIPRYKVHPYGPVETDMRIHKMLRDALGDDQVLMTDPVGEYSLGDAIRVGRQLEELGYEWFEEPFRDFELDKYAQLCAALDIPVAATETTRGCHWGVAQAIRQRAADIVRADVSWKDGVTGTLKIAHMAEAFGMNCEVHTTTMNYMDVANLHVECAIKNCKYFEYFVPEEDFMFPMSEKLPIDSSGTIHVPNKPGVGVDLDWELVERGCVSHKVYELAD